MTLRLWIPSILTPESVVVFLVPSCVQYTYLLYVPGPGVSIEELQQYAGDEHKVNDSTKSSNTAQLAERLKELRTHLWCSTPLPFPLPMEFATASCFIQTSSNNQSGNIRVYDPNHSKSLIGRFLHAQSGVQPDPIQWFLTDSPDTTEAPPRDMWSLTEFLIDSVTVSPSKGQHSLQALVWISQEIHSLFPTLDEYMSKHTPSRGQLRKFLESCEPVCKPTSQQQLMTQYCLRYQSIPAEIYVNMPQSLSLYFSVQSNEVRWRQKQNKAAEVVVTGRRYIDSATRKWLGRSLSDVVCDGLHYSCFYKEFKRLNSLSKTGDKAKLSKVQRIILDMRENTRSLDSLKRCDEWVFLSLLPPRDFEYVVSVLDSRHEYHKDIIDFSENGVEVNGKKRVSSSQTLTVHSFAKLQGFPPVSIVKLIRVLLGHHLPLAVWNKYISYMGSVVQCNCALHAGICELVGHDPFLQNPVDTEVFDGETPSNFSFVQSSVLRRYFSAKESDYLRLRELLLQHISQLNTTISSLPPSFRPPLRALCGSSNRPTQSPAEENILLSAIASSGVSSVIADTPDSFTNQTIHCAVQGGVPLLNTLTLHNYSDVWKVSVLHFPGTSDKFGEKELHVFFSLIHRLIKADTSSPVAFEKTTCVCVVGALGDLLDLYSALPTSIHARRITLQREVNNPWGIKRKFSEFVQNSVTVLLLTAVRVAWEGRPALQTTSFTVQEENPLWGLPYYLSCYLDGPRDVMMIIMLSDENMISNMHFACYRNRLNSVHIYTDSESPISFPVGPGLLQSLQEKIKGQPRGSAPPWWLPEDQSGPTGESVKVRNRSNF